MAYSYNNNTFKVKSVVSHKLILSSIACLFGLVSLFFLFGTGLNFVSNSNRLTELSLGELVWGGISTSLNPGLVVAFFLTIAASFITLGSSSFHYAGYLSFLLFIASGVLFFCIVPLTSSSLTIIGNAKNISLGYATYVVSITNFVCAILSFIAAWGE